MDKAQQHNLFIITGAPGSGKTAVMHELKKLGNITINEPAREIIVEQRLIDGNGIYNRDPMLFKELMLSRAIHHYQIAQRETSLIFFDRGIPDILAYSDCFQIPRGSEINAAKYFKYNKTIFFLPSWKEIYSNDEDRLISFEDAGIFGDNLRKIYTELEYEIVDVPLISVKNRVEFIFNYLKKNRL